jgi:hypothetical protein
LRGSDTPTTTQGLTSFSGALAFMLNSIVNCSGSVDSIVILSVVTVRAIIPALLRGRQSGGLGAGPHRLMCVGPRIFPRLFAKPAR